MRLVILWGLPQRQVINVLSGCNPTPLANEARIYHLYRVADVRRKGIQELETIYFSYQGWCLWQALKTTKRTCVSINFNTTALFLAFGSDSASQQLFFCVKAFQAFKSLILSVYISLITTQTKCIALKLMINNQVWIKHTSLYYDFWICLSWPVMKSAPLAPTLPVVSDWHSYMSLWHKVEKKN